MERMMETAPGVESVDVRLPHGRLDEDWSTPYYLFRRVVAILFAATVLIVFMPLVYLLAFLTRLESPGPLFYAGRRVEDTSLRHRNRPIGRDIDGTTMANPRF